MPFLIDFLNKKAANGGHLGIVKLLLEHGADKTIEKKYNAYTYSDDEDDDEDSFYRDYWSDGILDI
jgi:hypothetical protein